MLVVFADKIPDRIRGKMKLWFIEPIPTCFVSSVSDALAVEVAEKPYELCDDDSSILIVRSTNTPPGYVLKSRYGKASTLQKKVVSFNGLQLVQTLSPLPENNQPPEGG
ncbi:MAG: type I-E CRISPR-associated endoribonuclease Cas2e [Sutterella seckii]